MFNLILQSFSKSVLSFILPKRGSSLFTVPWDVAYEWEDLFVKTNLQISWKQNEKNKVNKKLIEEISKLNVLAIHDFAMARYKDALKAHKELEESDINKK